eukprot:9576878-Karenia_brevis.AAC.1
MGRTQKPRNRDEEQIKLPAQLTARKPFGVESRPQMGTKGWRGPENNGTEMCLHPALILL